jgi:hypothetical protein
MSLVQRAHSPDQFQVDGTLLEAQAVNTNGVWQPMGRIIPWSVTVRGSFTGTVTLYVSNQVTRPADGDNDQAVFQTFSSASSAGSSVGFRWIKARLSGWAAGAVTVDLMGGS